MTSQELKDKLTEDDIRMLLFEMGASIYYEDDDLWISDTICHQGKKPKLYYYKDSKSFHCYTECGQLDIFGVVMGYKGYTEEEFYKAINWICIKLNIDNCEYGFGKQEQISDWEFIRSYKKSNKKQIEYKPLIPYDENILKIFQNWYSEDWIKEGISIDTMKKYNIMYSPWQQKIIVPHMNINNQLIGVRGRSMLEEDIDRFGKYSPFKFGRKKFYNHSLGHNLHYNKSLIIYKIYIQLLHQS
jgi:hypothetical protein